MKTALTGLAIGDALGMPFEDSALRCRDLLRWKGEFQAGPANGARGPRLNAGQWTDDTHTARALASSLVAGGGHYDAGSAARHYVAWYESGDLRGAGADLCLALRRLRDGTAPGQAGTPASRSNSPAQRVAPLGLAYCQDLGLAAKLARLDARITHVTDEAVEGSVAVAAAVAALAAGAGKDDLVDTVLPLLRATRVRTLVLQARESSARIEPVRALVSLGTTKRAAETVATALYSFLHTSSFRDAVELAVRAAGNAGTRAAITGALAGTYYGCDQVLPYVDDLEESGGLLDLDSRLNAAALLLAG